MSWKSPVFRGLNRRGELALYVTACLGLLLAGLDAIAALWPSGQYGVIFVVIVAFATTATAWERDRQRDERERATTHQTLTVAEFIVRLQRLPPSVEITIQRPKEPGER